MDQRTNRRMPLLGYLTQPSTRKPRSRRLRCACTPLAALMITNSRKHCGKTTNVPQPACVDSYGPRSAYTARQSVDYNWQNKKVCSRILEILPRAYFQHTPPCTLSNPPPLSHQCLATRPSARRQGKSINSMHRTYLYNTLQDNPVLNKVKAGRQ